MDEDFESQYAAELEALDDMDFGPPMRGRKSLDFSTPGTAHVRSRVADINASLNESLTLHPLDSVSDADESCAELQSQTNPTSTGKENVDCNAQSGTLSRKRRSDDMYGAPSDDEDALLIDAEIPEMAPRVKRARTQATPAPAKYVGEDDDFIITPPPSPRPPTPPPQVDDITLSKRQQARQKMTTAINRMQNQDDRLLDGYDLERMRVHKKIPPGAYVNVTGETGKRVYMKLKSKEALKQSSTVLSGTSCLQLLGTPLDDLKQQVEEHRRRVLLEESERLSQTVQEQLGESSSHPEDYDDEVLDNGPSLWVDRYRPQQYIDLLSDESTNRTLLKWLKLWDFVVYNKDKKDKDKKSKAQDKKKLEQKKFFNKNMPEVNEELDQLNRPMLKVVMLAGPPGLGKTTMAHIVARHAGYNVVEMNASDDRSAEVFKQRIEAATQMKAVLGADPRPNCLVIDEIDGAPQPAINTLLTMIKQGDKEAGKTTKRKKQGGPLLRPIICICNDLYVPSLRLLRQQALVINVPQTITTTLAGRLVEISRREQIKTDLSTVVALCEKADNDIRSCLNTLQFVKSRSSQLSLQTVHSMSLGQKDAHKSLFNVWQHIFTIPKPKRKRYVNPHDRSGNPDAMKDLSAALAADNTTRAARFHNCLQMAMAAGEYQKVSQGLYENYLESKVKDHRMMDSVMLALEWMQFIDVIDKTIGHSQDYSMMRYTPYLPIIFHLLFATNHPQKITYPHTQFEVRTKTSRNATLVTTMINEMVPAVRKNLNVVVTVTELLPPLLSIVQPTLRPVNTQLYSAREKEGLSQLIQVMIAYNMTYHQERSLEGQYNYILDPNMDDVVRFPGLKPGRQLTYAAKQLIAREIELEKMRRTEAALGNKLRSANPVPAPVPQPQPDSAKPAAPQVPNHMRQTLQPKQVIDNAPVVDFFGRKVIITPQVQAKKELKSKQEIIGGDIWFKFKEGYTNAVRKTVRIKDFM